MWSTTAGTDETRVTVRALRRSAAAACCAVLGLCALIVPAGSASGEAPGQATASPAHRPVDAPPSAVPSASSRIESDISQVLRDSPGAVRTGPLEVSWDGGAVVSTWVPESSADTSARLADTPALGSTEGARLSVTSSYAGCPDGTTVHWFCFYENASYGGRMLQFRDCPSTQSLGAYGFANQTTSWVNNRSGVTITVYDGSTSGTVLWREYGRSHDSNVGSWANDRADTFTCRT